ncbi:MAG: hypothetical protein PHG16_06420 [Lachnospiraceae bacterium]|nr:hypothetical protein [Lachnospiraceae bacterium]
MNKKRKIYIISIIVICILFVGMYFFCNGKKPKKDLMVGGDDDHWFHSTGSVTEIDISNKYLTVEVEQPDDIIDQQSVKLDCKKFTTHMDQFIIGQKVTFYYFKSGINGSNVLIEDIY